MDRYGSGVSKVNDQIIVSTELKERITSAFLHISKQNGLTEKEKVIAFGHYLKKQEKMMTPGNIVSRLWPKVTTFEQILLLNKSSLLETIGCGEDGALVLSNIFSYTSMKMLQAKDTESELLRRI